MYSSRAREIADNINYITTYWAFNLKMHWNWDKCRPHAKPKLQITSVKCILNIFLVFVAFYWVHISQLSCNTMNPDKHNLPQVLIFFTGLEPFLSFNMQAYFNPTLINSFSVITLDVKDLSALNAKYAYKLQANWNSHAAQIL